MYKCPNCGMTSPTAGDCPTCKVPMVEEKAAAPAQSQPEQAQLPKEGEAGSATAGTPTQGS